MSTYQTLVGTIWLAKRGKKCWIRVSKWRFLGKGGVKTPLETSAWEANLDLLESPIPQRQDHSQTIYGQPLFYHWWSWSVTMVWNDPAMVKLWLDHGQPNHCQPYTFNGTNLTMVDHEQNYQRRDFNLWTVYDHGNTTITWLKIFKVKKTPWYNMINHVQGKSQTWNNIASDSHVWLWSKGHV